MLHKHKFNFGIAPLSLYYCSDRQYSPTVGSTVCIEKPTYFSKKRARERKRGERGEAKRHHPRNSSHRIDVGISTNIEFSGQKFVDKGVLLFRKH